MTLDSISDIGVKRKENQDNFWSALVKRDNQDEGIVCVCDGMGGLYNGQIASRIAAEAVRDSIQDGVSFLELESVLLQANKTIYQLGKQEAQKMGTTCTVLRCAQGVYEVLHVGDSRCYRVHKNVLHQCTEDHSALKKYNITRESNPAAWKKYRNALTKCLGVTEEVSVDLYKGTYDEGDIFIVCSDGLWHYLDKNPWQSSYIHKLSSLVDRCISSGETDNITCCVLYV